MPCLRDLDLARHLADPEMRQRFVTPLFNLVAPSYDAFTRAFSFGMDGRWKRALVGELAARATAGARVLDLACGTGDLSFAAANAVPQSRVTGVDASPRMIDLARRRAASATAGATASATARAMARARAGATTAAFTEGDMTCLPFPDGSVDAITAGYAFRNAPDHHAALREAARLLRPGGVMITLDLYRPERAPWRLLFLTYLRAAGNAVGWWWHREPVAYGYIAPSIAAFVSWRQFSADLADAGFEVQSVHTYLLGGVAAHVALRSAR